MDDAISRQVAIEALDEQIKICDNALCNFNISLKDEYAVKVERASLCAYKGILEDLPSAQPQYTELTPEEAASEIASGSIMSASYWLDAMIRLKQMGYAICRKKG